jgi:CxxC motif-containing protein (DUF1111 family)
MMMKTILLLSGLLIASVPAAGADEANAGFDGKPIDGYVVDQPAGATKKISYTDTKSSYENIEQSQKDGLGPLYNAQSCASCHQNPVTGAVSQVAELRAGHTTHDGRFVAAEIFINGGQDTIGGRTLVNDRAICPEYQERVPTKEKIRAFRLSLNTLGDGFVEAIADKTLTDLAAAQCADKQSGKSQVCGQALLVPVLEAPNKTAVGRFGWKDQHASLRSFSADAYLNEMGITTGLMPNEFTKDVKHVPPACAQAQLGAHPTDPSDPQRTNDVQNPDTLLEDAQMFTIFMRASKAPPRDTTIAQSAKAKRGEMMFAAAGCNVCHVDALKTAPAGTQLLGGSYTVQAALGDKVIHPYSDFLLHDVGTGDGIAIAVTEHYGVPHSEVKKAYGEKLEHYKLAKAAASSNPDSLPKAEAFTAVDQLMQREGFSYERVQDGRNKLRTPPLWGLRTHSRLMHDGRSVRLEEAIDRHQNEAASSTAAFKALPKADQEALLVFLSSL